jgi:hypothetical protein
MEVSLFAIEPSVIKNLKHCLNVSSSSFSERYATEGISVVAPEQRTKKSNRAGR